VHGESDEHFGHGTLLEGYGASALSGDSRLRVKAGENIATYVRSACAIRCN
jgi:hypothetical protein